MDFNITAEEQHLLFVIVDHLGTGNAPTVDELCSGVGRDVGPVARSLGSKGWVLLRDVEGQETVIALAPMALQAVRSLRYGRRE